MISRSSRAVRRNDATSSTTRSVAARPDRFPLRETVERILRQRSTLLRQSGGAPAPDVLATLDVWDEKLAQSGGELIRAREAFLAELEPLAAAAFRRLARLDDDLRLVYQRSFSGELADALGRSRREDLRRGTTTIGPQRDEILITAGGLDARTRYPRPPALRHPRRCDSRHTLR